MADGDYRSVVGAAYYPLLAILVITSLAIIFTHQPAPKDSHNTLELSPVKSRNPAAMPADNSSTTQLTVNGTNIPLPSNGNVRQTIPNEHGQTRIEATTKDSSSQNTSNISTHIDISSTGQSNSESHVHYESSSR